MSTYERIEALRSAITKRPPYCSGTSVVSSEGAKLYYELPSYGTALNQASWINLLQPTESDLGLLAQSCEPALFGLNQEDVLDESYRKALKMNREKFSTTFNLEESKILEHIRAELLTPRDSKKLLRAELYKLNIYGQGSFFKAHKDTPRSETMIASLVVIFPIQHDGGSLILRHENKEWAFDTATMLHHQDPSSVAYVAFYSDIDHEVSMVNSGCRVTLTYNLYLEKSQAALPTTVSHVESVFQAALSSALQDPGFLPEGGLLGFGLSFMYPIDRNTSMRTIGSNLKGIDAVIKGVCERLGLRVSLKAICDHEEHRVMVDEIFEMDPVQIDDHEVLDSILEGDGVLVDDPDGDGVTIEWVTSLTSNAQFESPFVRYGNEASLEYVYGDVCLIADVPDSERRVKI